MKILILICMLCAFTIGVEAQTGTGTSGKMKVVTKKDKKELILSIATTGYDFAGMYYDWRKANIHAGEQIAAGTYRCEGNGLYRSSGNSCYQSTQKYWLVNGSLLAGTSILKYILPIKWHLLGDSLDIGFGTIHFVSGRKWNGNYTVIGHYPR